MYFFVFKIAVNYDKCENYCEDYSKNNLSFAKHIVFFNIFTKLNNLKIKSNEIERYKY